MVTDEERRDVAEKFRCFDFLSAMRIGLARGGVSTGTLQVLGAIVGVDMTSPIECAQLFDRLADLIEPSCDRDALLALADEMESKTLNWDVTQGDVPLVHAGYLMGYADRIREALGDCQRGVSGAGNRGTPRGLSGQVGGRAQGSTRADRDEKE